MIVDVFREKRRRREGSRQVRLSSDEDTQAGSGQPQHAHNEPRMQRLPNLSANLLTTRGESPDCCP